MDNDLGRVRSEPGSREPSPTVSAASGVDPSRGTFRHDLDRAFTLTLTTLHLSEKNEANARLFYADGMNNHAGHLSPYMASRIIAGVFAALAALSDERLAIVRYINDCADAFSAVPVEAPEPDRREAYRYSLDAILRYHSLADHIKARAHRDSDGSGGADETGTGSAVGDSADP